MTDNNETVICPCCNCETHKGDMTIFIVDGDEHEICEGCAENNANHGTVWGNVTP